MILFVQLTLLLVSFIYVIFVAWLFFSKEKLENYDTKIYRNMIIIAICSVLVEVMLYFLAASYGKNSFFNNVFLFSSKIFVCVVVLWFFMMMKYSISLYERCNKGKILSRVSGATSY